MSTPPVYQAVTGRGTGAGLVAGAPDRYIGRALAWTLAAVPLVAAGYWLVRKKIGPNEPGVARRRRSLPGARAGASPAIASRPPPGPVNHLKVR